MLCVTKEKGKKGRSIVNKPIISGGKIEFLGFVAAHYLGPDLLFEIVVLLLPQRHSQRNHLIKQPFYDVFAGSILGVSVGAAQDVQVSLPIELLEELTLAITVILVPLDFCDGLCAPKIRGSGDNCESFRVTIGGITIQEREDIKMCRCSTRRCRDQRSMTHDLDRTDVADSQLMILLNLLALDLALSVDCLLADIQNLTPRRQVLESHPKPARNTV